VSHHKSSFRTEDQSAHQVMYVSLEYGLVGQYQLASTGIDEVVSVQVRANQ